MSPVSVPAPRSRLCECCEIRWPAAVARCPLCDGETEISALRATRSERQALEIRFRRYYDEREMKRVAAGHIAPEGIGRREARELIEEIAEMERRLAE